MSRQPDAAFLCECNRCGHPADSREAIQYEGRHYHGRCALESLGESVCLSLPFDESGKFRLNELGHRLGKRLLAIRYQQLRGYARRR